jgi:YggT family protein
MLGFQALDIFLVASLQQLNVSFPGLLLAAGWRLLDLLYDIYFYSILITVILSWFAPRGYNPAVALLFALTEPLLRLLRRILPPMGGVDLSPLLALIALQFTKMVVQPPLQQLIAMLN